MTRFEEEQDLAENDERIGRQSTLVCEGRVDAV